MGSYTVNGDQIVFNRDDGVCYNHPGTYHWEMRGNTLTLKPINDTCTDSDRVNRPGRPLMDPATVRASVSSAACPTRRGDFDNVTYTLAK